MRYNPYTYNPMLQSYFISGSFSNAPDTVAKIAVEQPALAQHVNSVWQFLDWMKNSSPELYATITNARPDLTDAATVVTSGALSRDKNAKKAGLSGLRAYETDFNIGETTDAKVETSWGSQLLDTIKNIAPSYFQLRTQDQLLKINIQRAEQGLPPLDSSTMAPTVNVGASPAIQQLGYVAVAGLVLVGLLAAVKRR